MTEPRERRPRRRPQSRRRTAARVLGVVALVVSFVVGIAVGEALHDNPRPGGSQTIVRTLDPLTLGPAGGSTVTVRIRKP